MNAIPWIIVLRMVFSVLVSAPVPSRHFPKGKKVKS